MSMTLRDQLQTSPLDVHFARLMGRLGGGDATVEDCARLLSAARGAGHTCLPLGKLTEEPRKLEMTLRRSAVVGEPGAFKPLILDAAGRLYLQRYWQLEQELGTAIRARLRAAPPEVTEAWLEAMLDRFQPLITGRTEDQRRAARAAMLSRFCVITGGPGTGKTRTIALLLGMLHEHARAHDNEAPRVALAAPTGKAAARMTEALQSAFSQPPLHKSMGEAKLPPAMTLHRLLGINPQTGAPKYRAEHPLAAEVVIVDEASMIDLALMAKLFAAVSPEARLILLGDGNQLASVEAGHVLGDICEAPENGSFVALTKNFRFSETSGIQQLSVAVKAGEAATVIALLTGRTLGGVTGRPLPAPGALPSLVRELVVPAYRAAMTAGDPLAALRSVGTLRILCAIRGGPYGVEHLNRLAEGALASAGLIHPGGMHYAGRPIMILQNEQHLGLFNGDIGILLPDPAAGGELRAFFASLQGEEARAFHPARLPEHETVWAMTVHKSQGSEFDRVLLLLPDRDNPVLTRELLYTAITRARESVEIWFTKTVLETAIARRTVRYSGLRDLLHAPTSSPCA